MNKRVSVAVRSDMGRIRKNNEDNLLCGGRYMSEEEVSAPFQQTQMLRTPCLLAVCDGMGGHEHGERASYLAVSTLAKHRKRIVSARSAEQTAQKISRCVEEANQQLVREIQAQASRMGTTMAAAVVTGRAVQAYNVGDSRVYLYQDNTLHQLSKDHTLVAQKIQMGILTPEEARTDPDRNKLIRFLGVAQEDIMGALEVAPPVPTEGYCRLLLCSDGLTDMLEDAQIAAILSETAGAEQAADALVRAALAAGGRDNVTCIVADIGAKRGMSGSGSKPKKKKPNLVALIVVLSVLALGIIATGILSMGRIGPFAPMPTTPKPTATLAPRPTATSTTFPNIVPKITP